MKPQNTALVAFHDDKENNTRFCFKLTEFLNEEAADFRYTEKYEELWNKRFSQMKQGMCAYHDRCPIFKRTAKKIGAIQLSLFSGLMEEVE